MEDLKQQKQIIDLGKLLVEQLGLDKSVDTLSRWMAHYLAEKLKNLESLHGEDKVVAEKDCSELILKLWQCRHSFINERRPFKDYDPIVDYLDKLNIKHEQPLFFDRIDTVNLPDLKEGNPELETIKGWLSVAKSIDKIARAQIEYSLNRAAKLAENDKTKEWIEVSKGISENCDLLIVERLLNIYLPEEDRKEDSTDDIKEEYEYRIEQLQKFSGINDFLVTAYQKEVDLLDEK